MKNKYYSLNSLFSHNSYFNFVMSGRGTGKSYSAKDQIIKNFLNKGKQAVYLRRSKAELDNVKNTYWNDIKSKYPDYDFKIVGDIGYIDNKEVVYFIPLSTSVTMKSATFPDVNLIVFDEYIITKTTHNRYLKNEMVLLFDIIETIFRDRPNVKVLFLSNSVSFVNPLFTYFDIEPVQNKRFQKFKNNLILLEIFSSEIFIEEKNKTDFARLIEGTHYYNYAIGNNTLEDNSTFIQKKEEGQYKFLCSFLHQGYEIGCWFNLKTCTVFIDNKVDSSSPCKYALKNEDVQFGYIHIKEQRLKNYVITEVKTSYNNGRLFFENQEIKKFFLENVIVLL